jgi:hypothetical protein
MCPEHLGFRPAADRLLVSIEWGVPVRGIENSKGNPFNVTFLSSHIGNIFRHGGIHTMVGFWLLYGDAGSGFTFNFDQLILFLDMHSIYLICILTRRKRCGLKSGRSWRGWVARGSRATCRAAGPILNVKADRASREKDVNVKLEPLLSRCSHMIEA